VNTTLVKCLHGSEQAFEAAARAMAQKKCLTLPKSHYDGGWRNAQSVAENLAPASHLTDREAWLLIAAFMIASANLDAANITMRIESRAYHIETAIVVEMPAVAACPCAVDGAPSPVGLYERGPERETNEYSFQRT